jgi:UDP-2,3-diacylglucosamine hydrolase
MLFCVLPKNQKRQAHNMKFTAFIADLHLEASQLGTFVLFKRFCSEYASKLDALYILGDLFVFWVGDDDLSDFNRSVVACLQGLVAQGVKVYLLPGNRDFLIGEKFAALSGCKVLQDPTKIDLYGMPVLLTHGDLLCSEKHRIHTMFRAITNRKQFKRVFLALPLKLRRKIAYLVNAISNGRRYNTPKRQAIFNIDEAIVRRLVNASGVKCLIHGHFHIGGVFPLLDSAAMAGTKKVDQIDNLAAIPLRVVLSEWANENGQMLLCYPDHRCRFENAV